VCKHLKLEDLSHLQGFEALHYVCYHTIKWPYDALRHLHLKQGVYTFPEQLRTILTENNIRRLNSTYNVVFPNKRLVQKRRARQSLHHYAKDL
jgi:hypothetical protein